MKKLILIFLLFVIFIPSVFAESFPPKGGRDEYPIYWYLHRHGEKLMKVLNTKKFFRLHGWGCEYLVKITRNGYVIPLEVIDSQNRYYDNQVRKIIESTKAEPFGDEIDLDEITVSILIEYADLMEAVDIWYHPKKNEGTGRYTIDVRTTK